MSKKNSGGKTGQYQSPGTGRKVINEGNVRKGGLKNPTTSLRPSPPPGQGGKKKQ